MKRTWIMMAATAVLAFGAVQESAQKTQSPTKAPVKNAPKAAPKKAAVTTKAAPKKEDPMAIPAGAKEIEPGLYRAVDAKGQAWLYKKTPFSVIKTPEPEGGASASAGEYIPSDWTVKEQGENVTFERPWPFGGKMTWTKKKSELNSTESEVWKRAQGASK